MYCRVILGYMFMTSCQVFVAALSGPSLGCITRHIAAQTALAIRNGSTSLGINDQVCPTRHGYEWERMCAVIVVYCIYNSTGTLIMMIDDVAGIGGLKCTEKV
jgi:hypothetical protein